MTSAHDKLPEHGEELTLENVITLGSLSPGKYKLEVAVTDNLAKKTITPSVRIHRSGRRLLAATAREVKLRESLDDSRFGPRDHVLPRPVRDSGEFVCWPPEHRAKLPASWLIPRGTPQMGATVVVTADQLVSNFSIQLLTNDRGRFSTATLPAGLYSVKVTLAGFLPVIEQDIQVNDQHTTLLEIVLGSVFTSFEKLRRQPDQQISSDEWCWVLRTSAATRPVLRWQDGDVILGVRSARHFDNPQNQQRSHSRRILLRRGPSRLDLQRRRFAGHRLRLRIRPRRSRQHVDGRPVQLCRQLRSGRLRHAVAACR